MQSLNTVEHYWNLLLSIIIFILLVACQITPEWVSADGVTGAVAFLNLFTELKVFQH